MKETTGFDRDLHVCTSAGNSDKGPVVKNALASPPCFLFAIVHYNSKSLDTGLSHTQPRLYRLSTEQLDKEN